MSILLNVSEVYKIVYIVMRICCSQLIRSKPPFIVDYKLILMYSSFNRYNKIKFVSISMHWDSFFPIIECSNNANLVPSIPPSENMVYEVFIIATFITSCISMLRFTAAAAHFMLCSCFEKP